MGAEDMAAEVCMAELCGKVRWVGKKLDITPHNLVKEVENLNSYQNIYHNCDSIRKACEAHLIHKAKTLVNEPLCIYKHDK